MKNKILKLIYASSGCAWYVLKKQNQRMTQMTINHVTAKKIEILQKGCESCINMCVISFWARLDWAIEKEMRKLRKRKGNEILAPFLNCFHVPQLMTCLVFTSKFTFETEKIS